MAESALGALKTEADPHLEAARVALESAVSKEHERTPKTRHYWLHSYPQLSQPKLLPFPISPR